MQYLPLLGTADGGFDSYLCTLKVGKVRITMHTNSPNLKVTTDDGREVPYPEISGRPSF